MLSPNSRRPQPVLSAVARQLHGPKRSPPAVVSGLYEKLDELRKLYSSDSIEEVLDLTIDIKRRLNRMAELQGKVVLSVHELREYQVLRQLMREYLAELARRKAQVRCNRCQKRYSQRQIIDGGREP